MDDSEGERLRFELGPVEQVQTIRQWWQAYGKGTSASAHPAGRD
jgi:hypothetical protein